MSIRNSKSLAKGQVWKTRSAHIEIVSLGKNYIHYRISPQLAPKRVSAQISGVEAMANYLRLNAATLAQGAVAN